MTSLLYFFQVAVVFLCPVFFGWVVLRRVVREHDVLVMIPGSVVVGSIALMAAMNELRYWLEMSMAAWFAYKLLLAAGLGLLIFTQRPRFGLRLAGGPNRRVWMIIALAGTVVTSLYFGIPAAHGLLNDSWWFHYPAATLVQDLKFFPIPSVFAPDDPLYYHFGPDILAGTWAYLLDCPVQTGFVVSICILAPSTFLLGYALVLRGSRSHLGALAAAVFLVAGGNLLFLRLPTAEFRVPLSVLERLNSESVDGLLKLMFTPSHACGIPAILVAVVIFWRFCVRPTGPLAALLGLWMGALTLIAEWYFFPLIGAVALLLLADTLAELRRTGWTLPSGSFVWLRAAPVVIALGFGFFNNTYVSGIFGHFWNHSLGPGPIARARLEQSHFDQGARDAEARQIYADFNRKPIFAPPPPEVAETGYSEADDAPLTAEHWTPPGLVPLRINLRHFGQVPSWESAGSSGGTFVPILSFRFVAECTPVILLGLPFGLWLSRRRRQPILRLLTLIALLSVLPPIFLDWGFRSTDFLRFFTGAFSFSALLLGWLLGYWWEAGPRLARVAALLVCVCVLVNPFVIGLLGLKGATFDAVKSVNQSAGSLKKAVIEEKAASSAKENPPDHNIVELPAGGSPTATASVQLSPAQRREVALMRLSELARRYLYPQTLGRERAIVIVPVDATPPTEIFPEWLKLATLTHLQLPIGWYWSNSLYAEYYREAVTRLSPGSVAALDARWIIVSNLFEPDPPEAVRHALRDPRRFTLARSYVTGAYYLNIYRALSFSAPPSTGELE